MYVYVCMYVCGMYVFVYWYVVYVYVYIHTYTYTHRLFTCSDWWLAHWIQALRSYAHTPSHTHTYTSEDALNIHFLDVLALIALFNTIIALIRAFVFAFGGKNVCMDVVMYVCSFLLAP